MQTTLTPFLTWTDYGRAFNCIIESYLFLLEAELIQAEGGGNSKDQQT